MELKVGLRLQAAAGTAELIVVRAPARPIELRCDGYELVDSGSEPGAAPAPADGAPSVLLGKRYVDESSGLELLCTKAGVGQLEADGRPLEIKAAKPLPASD